MNSRSWIAANAPLSNWTFERQAPTIGGVGWAQPARRVIAASNAALALMRRIMKPAGDHVNGIGHEGRRLGIDGVGEAETAVQPDRVDVLAVDEQRELARAELAGAPVRQLADEARAERLAAALRRHREAPEVAALDAQVALAERGERAVGEREARDLVDFRVFAEGRGREGEAELRAAPAAERIRVVEPGGELRQLRRIEAPEPHEAGWPRNRCQSRISARCAASCWRISSGMSQSVTAPTPSCVPARAQASGASVRKSAMFASLAASNARSPSSNESDR